MKLCAVDIKGNDAIFACVEGSSSQDFTLIARDVKKLKLKDALAQNDVKEFTSKIHAFFNSHNFDLVVIRARAMKGKFAGGPNSFKIEALIQTSSMEVKVIHAASIKAAIKNLSIDVDQVNAYQVKALELAISQLPK